MKSPYTRGRPARTWLAHVCPEIRALMVALGVAGGGTACSVPPGGSWHEVTLRCPFPGRMCNINIDECASNPCHNGGTCKDGINGFTCLCPEGFHDPKCLSEVNECNSNPCIHGRCHDGLNG